MSEESGSETQHAPFAIRLGYTLAVGGIGAGLTKAGYDSMAAWSSPCPPDVACNVMGPAFPSLLATIGVFCIVFAVAYLLTGYCPWGGSSAA